jgi:replicative DNA helicase
MDDDNWEDSAGTIPHSADVERILVGACIASIVFFRAASEEGISPEDFHILRHRYIWEAVSRLAEEDIQPEIVAVQDELERLNRQEGIDFLYLKTSVERSEDTTYDGIKEYARRLKDYTLRRHLLNCANGIATDAFDLSLPADKTLSKSLSQLQHTTEKGVNHDIRVGDVIETYEEEAFDSIANGIPPGLMTGLTDFDSLLKGLKPGRSGMVGARPGVGKTSLLLTITAYLMTRLETKHVIFNSMEMTWRGLMGRLIANIADLDGMLLEDPTKMTFDDQEKFKWATGLIKSWPLTIINHRDPITLYSKISQLVSMGKCDLLINDYVGKFEAKAESRVRQVAIASAYMSKIAVNLNIPVVTAAAVSRTIDQRGKDAELVMSDLKETGDLESDADWILFINPDATMTTVKHCNLIKNRFGKVGRFELVFKDRFSRFVNCVTRHVDFQRGGEDND